VGLRNTIEQTMLMPCAVVMLLRDYEILYVSTVNAVIVTKPLGIVRVKFFKVVTVILSGVNSKSSKVFPWVAHSKFKYFAFSTPYIFL